MNHVAEDGTVLPCDRQIVERCIRNWFGSVQQFEEFAAPLLRSTFDQQLGQDMFPYGSLAKGLGLRVEGWVEGLGCSRFRVCGVASCVPKPVSFRNRGLTKIRVPEEKPPKIV